MSGRAARAAKQRKRQALKDQIGQILRDAVLHHVQQTAYLLADWEPLYIDTTYTFDHRQPMPEGS